MNYDRAKDIIKSKYKRREITLKQYFNLITQARARFYITQKNTNVGDEKDDMYLTMFSGAFDI